MRPVETGFSTLTSAPPKRKVKIKKEVAFNAYLPHSFLFLTRPQAIRGSNNPTAHFSVLFQKCGRDKRGKHTANAPPSAAAKKSRKGRTGILAARPAKKSRAPSRRKFSKNAYSIYTVTPMAKVYHILGKKIKTPFVEKGVFFVFIFPLSPFFKAANL